MVQRCRRIEFLLVLLLIAALSWTGAGPAAAAETAPTSSTDVVTTTGDDVVYLNLTIISIGAPVEGSEPLAGVHYRVTRDVGGTVEVIEEDAVTGTNGEVTVGVANAEPGDSVTITELGRPEGYGYAIESEVTVKLRSESAARANFLHYPLGQLTITKLDEATSKPLAGAHYKITDTVGTIINPDAVTSQDGTVTVTLDRGYVTPSQNIWVEEIAPPAGYTLPYEPRRDVFLDDDYAGSVTFLNYPFPQLRIVKTIIPNGLPVPSPEGAYYRVTYSGPGESRVLYDNLGPTDEDGVVTAVLPNVPYGESVLVEEMVPSPGTYLEPLRSVAVGDNGIAELLLDTLALPNPVITTTETTQTTQTTQTTVTSSPPNTTASFTSSTAVNPTVLTSMQTVIAPPVTVYTPVAGPAIYPAPAQTAAQYYATPSTAQQLANTGMAVFGPALAGTLLVTAGALILGAACRRR